MRDDDQNLIWESYNSKVNESTSSMDQLIMKAADTFERMRGKKSSEDIIHELEQKYLRFFNNMPGFPDGAMLTQYIEDGGFRDDLSNHLGLDEGEDDTDAAWDRALDKHEY